MAKTNLATSRVLVFAAVSVVSLSGCAQLTGEKRPQLYPNEKLARTSSLDAEADVNRCMAMADDYIQDPNKYGSMAKQGLVGGALGAGTGALAGTITGSNVGRATGAGAAVGGILGVLRGLSDMNERSPSYERFVEHCLQRQGYEIIGWNVSR